MRRNFFRSLACLGAFIAASTTLPTAFAQAWPAKPVRIIVPATPGGTSDIFARAIATRMQVQMGVPVLVEYKPGAATNIATDYVAKAAPDGYTVLINGITLAVNPALYPALPFNPAKDLAPVIEIGEMTNIVTVNPGVPARSLKELVAYMKSQPDTLNYGSTGVGSSSNLAGELFALKTGTNLTHIAYQGNAQVTTDHIGGTLQLGFVNMPVGLPFVKSGKLRALAVTGSKRSTLLPDVPTVAEALGVPDYELTGWFGLMVPAATPAAVIERLHAEAEKALKDPGVRSIIATAGGDVVGGTMAAFAAHLKSDTTRLTEVIRVANISVR